MEKSLRNLKLEDVKFAFIDVETTGLNPQVDRICEIAIVVKKNSKEIASFSTLVNPLSPIPLNISKIHNITDEMVAGKPAFKDIIIKVLNMLENSVIVGHNVKFDYDFIDAEFNRYGYRIPRDGIIAVIDTLKISKKFGSFKNNKLKTIADSLNIKDLNWHRAYQDVLATIEIFEYFLVQFKKEGVDNLYDLIKMIE